MFYILVNFGSYADLKKPSLAKPYSIPTYNFYTDLSTEIEKEARLGR